MVIVVEEEKSNRIGLGRVVAWLLLLGTIAAATYYVFFQQPTLVESLLTDRDFPDSQTISTIKDTLPLDEIQRYLVDLREQAFQTPHSGQVGRSNPFLPP